MTFHFSTCLPKIFVGVGIVSWSQDHFPVTGPRFLQLWTVSHAYSCTELITFSHSVFSHKGPGLHSLFKIHNFKIYNNLDTVFVDLMEPNSESSSPQRIWSLLNKANWLKLMEFSQTKKIKSSFIWMSAKWFIDPKQQYWAAAMPHSDTLIPIANTPSSCHLFLSFSSDSPLKYHITWTSMP
jgi:hypothetical protein